MSFFKTCSCSSLVSFDSFSVPEGVCVLIISGLRDSLGVSMCENGNLERVPLMLLPMTITCGGILGTGGGFVGMPVWLEGLTASLSSKSPYGVGAPIPALCLVYHGQFPISLPFYPASAIKQRHDYFHADRNFQDH